MQKHFIVAVTVAVLIAAAPAADAARRRAITHPEPPFSEVMTEGGYASRPSVAQGESITLHIASESPSLMVDIVNLAAPGNILTRIPNVDTSAQNCSGRFATGCGWDASTTLTIPHNWPSGFYAARFETSRGRRWAPFIVRASDPGSRSSILVVSPTNTHQAYNRFGGASLYFNEFNDEEGRGNRVSYQRPYLDDDGLGRWRDYEQFFVQWMTAEGRMFEVASDLDLENPALLGNYDLVVFAGEAEFWTANARNNLEAYSRNGGHIAIFNANTMWWQMRLEDDNRTIVAFRNDAPSDDRAGENDPRLLTFNWYASPLNRPENAITGLSFRHGGYANRANTPPNVYELLPMEQRKGWTVKAPDHWVFANTGLQQGETFGRETVGLEVDGVPFNCDASGNIAGIDPASGTPLNYQILAVTPGSLGSGTMGLYVNAAGGVVFNAASQRWVFGLMDNEDIQAMTRNILSRLGSGAAQHYDARQSTVLTQDSFNCQAYTSFAMPGWTANFPAEAPRRATVTQRCAFEGPGGVELSGAEGIEMTRPLLPDGGTRDHVELRFHVNVDQYQRRFDYPLPLVTLRHANSHIVQPVLVEFDVVDGQKMIRVARRDDAGNFYPSEWLTLGGGWHLVELTWRSPGTIALQVDGGRTVTIQNPVSGQRVSDVAIEYLRAEREESGYVCVDALSVGTQK